ncbi:hypothetical protein NG800_014000 [Epilithonimonas ginsengisoli]|uniref:FHA domain-containing protein n=1 Tax=Epilithonimonas ginsengisoli TaxID=1245592 RepID=A0ABU4JK00_9FLAO|nr:MULTISPECIES: hypothetical protein [Chryseobacterium group]MBV6880449.1 hypothetical protein [Epilithonimonas sp. FP105]MDW8550034.1 hypothetical protein [Epilithonimonas ginsengisoli]OAH69214.1 hypothetical protein AXA65_15430 [Chryseobacterium sp. FP211-J200]
MRPKDKEKILIDLKNLIEKKLLADKKIGKGRPVNSVESVDIADFKINDDEEDRDKIIVTDVHAFVRIHLEFVENSFSSQNVQMRNNKEIEFKYNKEMDYYDLVENDVIFYNNASF